MNEERFFERDMFRFGQDNCHDFGCHVPERDHCWEFRMEDRREQRRECRDDCRCEQRHECRRDQCHPCPHELDCPEECKHEFNRHSGCCMIEEGIRDMQQGCREARRGIAAIMQCCACEGEELLRKAICEIEEGIHDVHEGLEKNSHWQGRDVYKPIHECLCRKQEKLDCMKKDLEDIRCGKIHEAVKCLCEDLRQVEREIDELICLVEKINEMDLKCIKQAMCDINENIEYLARGIEEITDDRCGRGVRRQREALCDIERCICAITEALEHTCFDDDHKGRKKVWEGVCDMREGADDIACGIEKIEHDCVCEGIKEQRKGIRQIREGEHDIEEGLRDLFCRNICFS